MEQLRREPDRVPLAMLYVTVAFAALLPEYLAPLLTLFFFPVFKRNCTKLDRKVTLGYTGKALLAFALFGVVSALWSVTPIMSAGFVPGEQNWQCPTVRTRVKLSMPAWRLVGYMYPSI